MCTNCAHHPIVCLQHYLRAYSNNKNWVSKKSTSVTNKTNHKWKSFKVLEHPRSCSWLKSILYFLVLKEHMAVCVWLWFFPLLCLYKCVLIKCDKTCRNTIHMYNKNVMHEAGFYHTTGPVRCLYITKKESWITMQTKLINTYTVQRHVFLNRFFVCVTYPYKMLNWNNCYTCF